MSICIKCGCTDDRACIGGCWWVRKNVVPVEHRGVRYLRGELGICSECDDGSPEEGFVAVGQFEGAGDFDVETLDLVTLEEQRHE